ncbi:hypothetical protein BBP40_002182 [Aspergillus hancockii]|nr:hypothetical protein BBP40_002182 [Aspergillus hancockii]
MAIPEEIIEWVRLGRGGFDPLILKGKDSTTLPSELQDEIQSLKRANLALSDKDEHRDGHVYDEAIGLLELAMANMTKGKEATITMFSWAFSILTFFVELMKVRRHFIMVILAYYEVIMYHIRRFWWMGDWGTRAIQGIYKRLTEEWRQSISWVGYTSGFGLSHHA